MYRVSVAQPLPVDGAERTLRFCFSDNSVDRMNDTIAAAGWDLTDFLANPVALWAHDSSAPPIGGARNVGVEGDRLLGDIEFAPPETYAFADTIYRLVLGKFLRAVSVGFLPTRYAFVENDPERGFGIDFLEQSPPRNQRLPGAGKPERAARGAPQGHRHAAVGGMGGANARRRAAEVSLPRGELERLRRAAKEPTMTRPTPRRTAGKPTNAHRSGGAERNRPHGRRRDCRQLRPQGLMSACGMTDPSECSIHAGAELDLDSDGSEAPGWPLRRLLPRRKEGGEPGRRPAGGA